MTNPITQYGRLAQMDPTARPSASKGEARATSSRDSLMGAVLSGGSDELQLSAVAQEAMKEPQFDRAKVEAIKQAIQQGHYPLDVRRIAESFVAIEQMIKG